MKHIIISPHCDDAIFSLGGFITETKGVIIVSPFDGLPNDEKGFQKHTMLNDEHAKACSVIGAGIRRGMFLDDVYPNRDISGLVEWFDVILKTFDPNESTIYVPLGIHHPDHVLVRDIFIKHFRIDHFYEELPYQVRYPYLSENLRMLLLKNRTQTLFMSNKKKLESVEMYKSQIDESVLNDVMVEERIWS
jgi:LmbE family N-acetylglucosaminyl deacetylase